LLEWEVDINPLLIKRIKKLIKRIIYFTYFEYLYQFGFFRSKLRKSKSNLPLRWIDRYPVLTDRTKKTGFDAHYIYHPAWAARILAASNPAIHVDISSSLHFCSIVSSFVNVEFYDYRPAKLELDNLTCKFADITKLPFSDNSLVSLSCMHVVEHIGLGRYGDLLDPDGDLKAIAELQRVVKPGGDLIFVVPVGKPRICFNAHRIYDPISILKYFKNMELIEFAVVTDESQFKRHVSPDAYMNQKYACGCYYFRRLMN